jgi:hypothetical protein
MSIVCLKHHFSLSIFKKGIRPRHGYLVLPLISILEIWQYTTLRAVEVAGSSTALTPTNQT